jgi:hypothetical protein
MAPAYPVRRKRGQFPCALVAAGRALTAAGRPAWRPHQILRNGVRIVVSEEKVVSSLFPLLVREADDLVIAADTKEIGTEAGISRILGDTIAQVRTTEVELCTFGRRVARRVLCKVATRTRANTGRTRRLPDTLDWLYWDGQLRRNT